MLFKVKKLFLILRNPYFLRALWSWRVAASVEHRYALTCAKFQTIVDIGANRGQFTLAARYFSPNASIYSFEPLSEPASIFRKVFQNSPKVTLFQTAIGESTSKSFIHISKCDDSSSLLPISSKQEEIFPGTGEVSIEEVSVAPLSAFVPITQLIAPAMLKIDVQGFESQVLSGADPLLDYFDYIYCECSFIELYTGQVLAENIVSMLKNRGFGLKGVFNLAYAVGGNPIQGDFLFSRKISSSTTIHRDT